MKSLAIVCCLIFITGCEKATSPPENVAVTSDIELDETLVFFNTSGWLDVSKQEWHVPIHGWIYEPEDSTVRIAAFEQILESKYDLAIVDETRDNFSRRINLLIADNERGKSIVINIAGRNFRLNESHENGHFETTINLNAADVEQYAPDGFIHFSAVTAAGDERIFSGTARMLAPNGVSVISDIDDTVKISDVGDRRSLLRQAFLRDFAAAPGMAELYNAWSDDGVAFHYVSSSPWQLYVPLNEFLQQADFPWATFSLKAIRFRDETLFDLFKEGTETKPAAIRKILDQYPNRNFVLVGDSGEQDPEVYATFLRERPEQVLATFIRNVTAENIDDARFAELSVDIDQHRWQLFDTPQEIDLTELPSLTTP